MENKFIKIRCNKCKKEKNTFEKATTTVKCECGEELAIPSGGKAKLKAKLVEILK